MIRHLLALEVHATTAATAPLQCAALFVHIRIRYVAVGALKERVPN